MFEPKLAEKHTAYTQTLIQQAEESSQSRNQARAGIQPAQDSSQSRNPASTGIKPEQESGQHRNQARAGINFALIL